MRLITTVISRVHSHNPLAEIAAPTANKHCALPPHLPPRQRHTRDREYRQQTQRAVHRPANILVGQPSQFHCHLPRFMNFDAVVKICTNPATAPTMIPTTWIQSVWKW